MSGEGWVKVNRVQFRSFRNTVEAMRGDVAFFYTSWRLLYGSFHGATGFTRLKNNKYKEERRIRHEIQLQVRIQLEVQLGNDQGCSYYIRGIPGTHIRL